MSISMTQPSMPPQLDQRLLRHVGSEQSHALSITVIFHLLVTSLLLTDWQQTQLPEPNIKVIKVQMMVQALQSQPTPPTVQPLPTPQQVVKPLELTHVISESKLAKKRVDEEKKPQPLNVKEQPKPIEETELTSQSTSNVESQSITVKNETVKSNESVSEAKPSAESASTKAAANNFDVS